MNRRVVFNIGLTVVILAAAGAGTVALVLSRKKPQKQDPQPVVPKVQAEPFRAIEKYSVRIVGDASARAKVSVPIVPQVSGRVTDEIAVNCRSGQYVKFGQPLFQIDKTDYEQARDVAAAQLKLVTANLTSLAQEELNLAASHALAAERLKLAERKLADVQSLRDRGAAGQSDLDSASDALLARKEQRQTIVNQQRLIASRRVQLQADQAVRTAQLAQAKTALARTTYASPVDGRVLSGTVEVGTRVQAGQSYGEVYGLKVMEIAVPVLAADLRWIDASLLRPDKDGLTPAEKQKLIRADVHWRRNENGQDRSWVGYVGRSEAGLEARTRTARLVVYVENPEPESGKPLLDRNMFCKVVIHGRAVEKAFLLPRSAILPEGGVYVVVDGRLKFRPVTVERFTDEEAMVFPGGGLADGDVVCTGYVPKAVNNMKVEVVAPTSAPAPARRVAPAGSTSRRGRE